MCQAGRRPEQVTLFATADERFACKSKDHAVENTYSESGAWRGLLERPGNARAVPVLCLPGYLRQRGTALPISTRLRLLPLFDSQQ